MSDCEKVKKEEVKEEVKEDEIEEIVQVDDFMISISDRMIA